VTRDVRPEVKQQTEKASADYVDFRRLRVCAIASNLRKSA
jgi:hypothetical protein